MYSFFSSPATTFMTYGIVVVTQDWNWLAGKWACPPHFLL